MSVARATGIQELGNGRCDDCWRRQRGCGRFGGYFAQRLRSGLRTHGRSSPGAGAVRGSGGSRRGRGLRGLGGRGVGGRRRSGGRSFDSERVVDARSGLEERAAYSIVLGAAGKPGREFWTNWRTRLQAGIRSLFRPNAHRKTGTTRSR